MGNPSLDQVHALWLKSKQLQFMCMDFKCKVHATRFSSEFSGKLGSRFGGGVLAVGNSYIRGEIIQFKACHSNNSVNWCFVVTIIICVYSIAIFSRHCFAFFLINSTCSLVVVHMTKQGQINLVKS